MAEDKQYIARLIAADIAERVLPIFEKERPDDDRPRKAIEAARKFARGEIDDKARDAAGDAAWAAARDANLKTLLQYLDGEKSQDEGE